MLTFPHFEPTFPREKWTLPNVLERQAKVRGDARFLSWNDSDEYSFAQTNRIANRIAHGFAKLGISKGDKVGILLPNCPQFVFTWFGLAKIGAVEVAISDAYKGRFLAHPINLSNARFVVTTADLASRLAEIEDDIPGLERVFLVDDGAADPVPDFKRIAVCDYDTLLAPDESNPSVAISPFDPVAVLMTSGTTGVSKGVLMSHSQFYFFAEENVQLTRLTAQDVYMTGFPLFHGNAQFLTVYPALIAGSSVALYPRFSASDWSGRAKRSGATVTNLLGATMSFILAKPEIGDDRSHRVRTIYAAPLDFELGRRFTERFGVSDYVDGFGQTEISNVFMTPPGADRPAGASGVLVDQWFEVRLADPETGAAVAEGETGELLVRPKAPGIICMEYLGMPEKTVETWRDLWFHTGDGMRRDPEGWYYFVDRVKDALRRRGENISSFEVEAGVRAHPSVQDCAVVGVSADEAGGEDEVMAFVVLKSGAHPDPAGILAVCKKELPDFMVPRYLHFLDALPLTATEKVRKKELRAHGVTPDTWDSITAGKATSVTNTCSKTV